MTKAETPIMRAIQLALGSRTDTRLFRQDVGQGWVGRPKRYPDGSVLVSNARTMKFGLCLGSSDLIGWRSVEITPDMVGQRVAVFTAIEVKTPTGTASPNQRNFLEQVRSAGGIAGIARSPDEAAEVLEGEQP